MRHLSSIHDTTGSLSTLGIEEIRGKYNVDSFADRLRYLHALLVSDFDSVDDHIRAYLEAGCAFFGATRAALIQLDEVLLDSEVYMSLRVVGTSAETIVARNCGNESADVYSKLVIASAEPIAMADCTLVGSSKIGCEELSYNGDVAAYIGAPVVVHGQLCGVISFFLSNLEGREFNAIDLETVDLMAKGVAKMMELQRIKRDEEGRSTSAFATAGIKSYAEYVSQARLPEVYGVPGRVVEVLERRISKLSLAIDYVAEELNLSKRTLQRRLQQQNISFAQLRDQVRFHHAIQYLVEHNHSIDSISASLDFSDRTSFTNAFKRWTGLSPSTFRKLFRDYA